MNEVLAWNVLFVVLVISMCRVFEFVWSCVYFELYFILYSLIANFMCVL
jgi:hypothetical protein